MIYSVFEIIATMSDVVFLCWFVPSFLKTKLFCKSKAILTIIPVLLLGFQFVADFFFPDFDVLYLVVFSAFVFTFSFLIRPHKSSILRAIIAASLFIVIEMLVSSLVHVLFSLFISDITTILQGGKSIGRAIYLTVCALVRYIIFKILLISFASIDGPDRKKGLFVSAYLTVTVAGLVILMNFAVKGGEENATYSLSMLCFIVISMIFVILMFRQVSLLQKKQYELSIMNERLATAKESAAEASSIWERVRKVRHEFRNHLAVIGAKIDSDDKEGAKEYISRISDSVEHSGDIIKSGNPVIDYLVNSKISRLDQTKVIVSGYVSGFSDIDEADIACLIGNLLDNAIDAEMKISDVSKRRIELHFLTQNQNRIIVCKNTIEESVLKNNPDLKTTKDDPLSHGIGHKVIEEVASKYYGFVNYSEIDDMFCVQVILSQTCD